MSQLHFGIIALNSSFFFDKEELKNKCRFLVFFSKIEQTSFDQVFSILYQILGDFRVAEEVFEAKKVKNSTTNVEECSQTKQNDEHGEIYVEAVANERYNVHVPHYLQFKLCQDSRNI